MQQNIHINNKPISANMYLESIPLIPCRCKYGFARLLFLVLAMGEAMVEAMVRVLVLIMVMVQAMAEVKVKVKVKAGVKATALAVVMARVLEWDLDLDLDYHFSRYLARFSLLHCYLFADPLQPQTVEMPVSLSEKCPK